MPTAVVSGRVDQEVKIRADAVIRNAGETVASVIGAVWQEIAATGELPEVVTRAAVHEKKHETLAAFLSWADALPEPSQTYAGMSDEEILAFRVDDYA